MKKLMFGAALAATSMAFAAQPAAQVYDVTLNIKSTAADTATVNNKSNPLAVAPGDPSVDIIYRKQASYTWKGLIWGCDCESIDGVWELVKPCDDVIKNNDTVKGCIIWDNKSKEVMFVGDESKFFYQDADDLIPDVSDVVGKGFGWEFLHCINKDAKQIEGYWTMEQYAPVCDPETPESRFVFTGAGFGTVNPVVLTDTYKDADGKNVTDYAWDCSSYIKKMSGNFAGIMWKPSLQTKGSASGCAFCGGRVVQGVCATADDIWPWCESFGGTCGCDLQLFLDDDHTAAYGTWTIAYNSGVSKKLSTLIDLKKIEKTYVYSITQAYNFKNLPKVLAMVELLENEVIKQQGTIEPTSDCKEATADYEAAVEAYNTAVTENAQAQAAYFAAIENELNVTDEALQDALNDATAKYNTAVANEATAKATYDAAVAATNKTGTAYIAMTDAIAETNLAWKVSYTDTSIVLGQGAQKLIDELADSAKTPKANGIEYGTYSWSDKSTATTVLKGFITTADTTAKAYDALVKAAEDAKVKYAAAQTATQVATTAKNAAQNAYNNRATLQKQAAVEVASTKIALDDAKANLVSKTTLKDAAEVAMKKACAD